MNPATYLRVNGPEPWSVCYVEPSIRPDDSRYGLNPNRLQRHTQVKSARATLDFSSHAVCRYHNDIAAACETGARVVAIVLHTSLSLDDIFTMCVLQYVGPESALCADAADSFLIDFLPTVCSCK